MSATLFPVSDEAARFIEHGRGLGHVHGERVKRATPCGIYVWPDDDGRSTPRTTVTPAAVTCPRCLAVTP